MKYLLIGDANAVIIKSFIDKVVMKQELYKIYILSRTNTRYRQYYIDNNICVFDAQGFLKTNFFKHMSLILKTIKHGPYDIIHIHYVKLYALLLSKLIKKGKVIASFWGSDLLRVSRNYKKILFLCIKYVDCITFETSYMRKQFENISNQKSSVPLKELLFGIEAFDIIDDLNLHGLNKKLAKKRLGIEEDKIIIAVGYNAKPCQQHMDVLKIIERLDKSNLEKIHIFLQLSYGESSAEYLNSLKNKLLSLGCSYTMEYHFLDKEATGILRLASDIFIHAQITDSLSSSVMEYLYSENMLFNPCWIKYEELDNQDILYQSYQDWDDLFIKLKHYLDHYNTEKLKLVTSSNKSKLYEMMSWNSVSKKWLSLYH